MRRRDFLSLSATAPLALAQDGRTPYSVCLSRDASPSERRAAAELRSFVRQMCRAELPVMHDGETADGPLILLGQSERLDRLGLDVPYAKLGAEGFVLKTAGPHVVIAGGRKRGTMYGAYALLEKLGCRWYARDCTRIPRVQNLVLPPLDETQTPAFEYREVFITEAFDRDWAARNRTNGHFTHLDDSTGGKITYYPFGHSFHAIVPPERYFATHPEYFALVNGERRAERAQLCLTHPDVLRIGIETVRRWIAEHPEATIFSVSQNDADAWCECGRCQRIEQEEGAPIGPILHYVNAIAEAIAPKHPDKLIDTFAYRYSEKPPLKVRPHPNVRVRLALSGACQGHPYERCPRNRYLMEYLRSWARVTGRLYVWHYMTNFHQYQAPYPNFDELAADLAMYRRHGTVGLFLQGAFAPGGGGELAELRSYVLARLLWNPALDAGKIIREFLGAYYGPAAPAMREYLDWMHVEVREPPRGLGKPIYLYRGPHFRPTFVPGARKLFARMRADTADAPDFAPRVAKAELSVDWAELFAAKRFVVQPHGYGPADPVFFWTKFEAWTARARAFGITSTFEGLPLDEMEREYRRFVKIHQIAVLENRLLRAVVVPSYHGRIVSLENRGIGCNAVRESYPEERFTGMEMLGGIVLLLHPDFYTRPRFEPEWSVESNTGTEMGLRGECENGLRVWRRLWLDAESPLLMTSTTVTNASAAPVAVTLHSRADANPGDPENPTIDFAFTPRRGAVVRKTLVPPIAENQGDEFFRGDQKPDGEWRLINSSLGFTLANTFPFEQVERCRMWWRGRKQNPFSIGLWSPRRTLQPGESLSLDAGYRVDPYPKG